MKKYFNPLKPDSARIVYQILPPEYADPEVAPSPIKMEVEIRDKDSVLVYGPRELTTQEQKYQLLWWDGKDNSGEVVDMEKGPFSVHLNLRYRDIRQEPGKISRIVSVSAARLLLAISGPNEGSFTSRVGENEVWCLANISPFYFSEYLDELNWTIEDWPDSLEDPPVNSGDPDDPEPGRLVSFTVENLPAADDGRGGPLKYRVTATLNIEGSTITEVDSVKQDNLDDLRQEYLDVRIGGRSADRVPTRNEFDQEQPLYSGLLGTQGYEVRHEWRILHSLNQFAHDVDESYAGNLYPISGYRCPAGNKAVGSTSPNSNHVYGQAFDIDQGGTPQDRGIENWRVIQVPEATADSYLWLTYADNRRERRFKNQSPYLIHPNNLPEGAFYSSGHIAH